MPEVLSGNFYRLLDNAVPHQMFSEITAIPGLVDGILGLDLDVPNRALKWIPSLPPSWPTVGLQGFPFGQDKMDFALRQSSGLVTASIRASSSHAVSLQFSPALPMGSTVLSVKQDGKPVHYQVEGNASDPHVLVNTSFSDATQIEVRFKPGVALEAERLPLLEGDISRNLRILRTSFTDGQIEMTVEGRPGQIYEVRAYTPLKLTANEGVRSIKDRGNYKTIELVPPVDSRLVDKAGYTRWQVRVRAEP
jgi:hypothetical protein